MSGRYRYLLLELGSQCNNAVLISTRFTVLANLKKVSVLRGRFGFEEATLKASMRFVHILGTCTQDLTSPRPNTLSDDADDIQRQLDNEARDRAKYGRPKTIWVLHFPTRLPKPRGIGTKRNSFAIKVYRARRADCEEMSPPRLDSPAWDYEGQTSWAKSYPHCGGRSQSPANLPTRGLAPAHTGRRLEFCHFEVEPTAMSLVRDGQRIFLRGEWASGARPLLHGGAAHSRKYLFHSLTMHSPSEHAVGGLLYPLESQLLFVSAEYGSLEDAINASRSDPQAMLGIASMYKYAQHTQPGLVTIISAALALESGNQSLPPQPLAHFSPPFSEYACYQGSLPWPPCAEAVLWLVRARTLPVTREVVEAAHGIVGAGGVPVRFRSRSVQPLNDRTVFYFRNRN